MYLLLQYEGPVTDNGGAILDEASRPVEHELGFFFSFLRIYIIEHVVQLETW